ncbi:hypothetical protein B0H16DRAFT_827881 [Mycena metata]|uniref:Uncharacterized protein n=1 Tax=Mycena metata TaxID=1033252 RepID=A0AAD7GIW2_9AGAR|nr:hypothetical protein B0H16DRAFT_827881 [Mycena metata]
MVPLVAHATRRDTTRARRRRYSPPRMNVHLHAYPTAFAHAPDTHPRPLASPAHASKDAAHRTRTLLRLRLSTRVHTHASGSVNTRTLASPRQHAHPRLVLRAPGVILTGLLLLASCGLLRLAISLAIAGIILRFRESAVPLGMGGVSSCLLLFFPSCFCFGGWTGEGEEGVVLESKRRLWSVRGRCCSDRREQALCCSRRGRMLSGDVGREVWGGGVIGSGCAGAGTEGASVGGHRTRTRTRVSRRARVALGKKRAGGGLSAGVCGGGVHYTTEGHELARVVGRRMRSRLGYQAGIVTAQSEVIQFAIIKL